MIRIADNGIGMTEDVKQHIFDHLLTTKAGLAIAHQIVVEKHGGAIEANSILHQGTETEFVILLPVNG